MGAFFCEEAEMNKQSLVAWGVAGVIFAGYLWYDRQPKSFKDKDTEKWNTGVKAKLKAKGEEPATTEQTAAAPQTASALTAAATPTAPPKH